MNLFQYSYSSERCAAARYVFEYQLWVKIEKETRSNFTNKTNWSFCVCDDGVDNPLAGWCLLHVHTALDISMTIQTDVCPYSHGYFHDHPCVIWQKNILIYFSMFLSRIVGCLKNKFSITIIIFAPLLFFICLFNSKTWNCLHNCVFEINYTF